MDDGTDDSLDYDLIRHGNGYLPALQTIWNNDGVFGLVRNGLDIYQQATQWIWQIYRGIWVGMKAVLVSLQRWIPSGPSVIQLPPLPALFLPSREHN